MFLAEAWDCFMEFAQRIAVAADGLSLVRIRVQQTHGDGFVGLSEVAVVPLEAAP